MVPEIGIHHHIAGAYLLRYAQESSWREDNRRVSNGDQVNRVAALAMKARQVGGLHGLLAAACCSLRASKSGVMFHVDRGGANSRCQKLASSEVVA